jgi:hypothetical protein
MPERRKWFDSSQPQTLQGAVILCYITAAFGILWILLGAYSLLGIIPLGLGVAGFGVANEWRWAYGLGIALAALNILGDVGILALGAYSILITLLFAVVLFALLVHPQSREYQRIWFK